MKIISCLSQKGGTGKSTLARLLAVELTKAGLATLLADFDLAQQTAYRWSLRRQQAPLVVTECFRSVEQLQRKLLSNPFQVVVIDCPPFASELTFQIAQISDFIIQPCRPSLDDLEPSVQTFHHLVQSGIPVEKLILILNQVISLNDSSEKKARYYLANSPYYLLPASLLTRASYVTAHASGLAISEVKIAGTHQSTQEFFELLLEKLLTN